MASIAAYLFSGCFVLFCSNPKYPVGFLVQNDTVIEAIFFPKKVISDIFIESLHLDFINIFEHV